MLYHVVKAVRGTVRGRKILFSAFMIWLYGIVWYNEKCGNPPSPVELLTPFVDGVRLKRWLPDIPRERNGGCICSSRRKFFPKGGSAYRISSNSLLDCIDYLDHYSGRWLVQSEKEEVSHLPQSDDSLALWSFASHSDVVHVRGNRLGFHVFIIYHLMSHSQYTERTKMCSVFV